MYSSIDSSSSGQTLSQIQTSITHINVLNGDVVSDLSYVLNKMTVIHL